MERIGVIGGGSWGTALAIHLAGLGHRVTLWVYEPDLAESMAINRENTVFLPGFRLPDGLIVTNRMEEALDGARVVLTVMPSHVCRIVAGQMKPLLHGDQILVSATKGLEEGSLLRMSQVLGEVLGETLGPDRMTVLSGPSFAKEVAAGHPTAVVIASENRDSAETIQQVFSGQTFRFYTEQDVVGVEMGGAVKNVVAIAAGVIRGLGFGANTVAALITRGLVEMERLALALGANPGTLAGLSGMGDLVLTCTSELSRNNQLGRKLGRGMTLEQALEGMVMVAEGVKTTRSVHELAGKKDVEMPITQEMDGILHRRVDPKEAITRLMDRKLKPEKE